MAKYSKKAASKVERAMHERKKGTLKSGSNGKKVTSKKQAIAIGLSDARAEGAKVPKKKKAASKSASKKSASKKSATKKSGTKKSASKKSATRKKAAPKKAASRRKTKTARKKK